MEILAYVLSFVGLASMIAASLVKGKRMMLILFCVFSGNLLFGLSYLADGSGFNGAASCFVGAAQTIINFFFERKDKKIPIWLIIIYVISFIGVNIYVGGLVPLSFLAICATLAFIMSIVQQSGAKYRFWITLNVLLWCAYDIITQNYAVLITHVILMVFTIAGMIIHDRRQKAK